MWNSSKRHHTDIHSHTPISKIWRSWESYGIMVDIGRFWRSFLTQDWGIEKAYDSFEEPVGVDFAQSPVFPCNSMLLENLMLPLLWKEFVDVFCHFSAIQCISHTFHTWRGNPCHPVTLSAQKGPLGGSCSWCGWAPKTRDRNDRSGCQVATKTRTWSDKVVPVWKHS